jgi:ribosomal protein S18 acetylase RimI-like enzyme
MTSFRVAVPADAKSLVELIRSAYRGEASRKGWTSEADLVSGERINVEQVIGIINGSSSMMLVLDREEGVVACCQLADQGDGLAYFGTFAVSPTEQGAGLGRRLMAEAERQAMLRFRSRMLEITVLAQQEILISWYERLGFRRTGETRPFPADEKFARPLRDGLYFVTLIKNLPIQQMD